uniref:RING-type E3 ubiquitin transferase n=1 Tax=Oryza brachyantha TaxID=4533 RepID=J3LK18_ORYBR
MDAPPAFASSSPSPSSSNASVPMVVITVVGILAAFALLASYYAFGNAGCPFCRSDVTLPFPPPVSTSARTAPCTHPVSCSDGDAAADSARHRRRSDELINSIVIEVRGEHESWAVSHGGAPATRTNKQESVGDEAIDTRKKCEEFAVQPMRRSLSMDSSCHKQLYVSVQEFLTQRQV